MNYPVLLDYGLVGDLNFLSGNGELDQLSDHLLLDIGYKRVGGRIIKDPDLIAEPTVRGRGWSWSLWGNRFTPKVLPNTATPA